MSKLYAEKGWRSTTKVGAFKWGDYSTLQTAVHALCNRVVAYHINLGLTTQDIMKLFVDPAHHDVARRAVTELGASPVSELVTRLIHKDITLNISLNHKPQHGWVAPAYIGTHLFDHPEAKAKLVSWVERRLEIGREFSLVNEVLFTLNKTCPNEHTVRYLWSTIIGLATVGGNEALADRVRECKPVKHIPALPPALRDALEPTRVTTVKAMMLPPYRNDSPTEPEGRIVLNSGHPVQLSPWDQMAVMENM